MSTPPRLLPWSNSAGKRCYLVTDDDGNSRMSRFADEMEAMQLRAGAELLGHAAEMLGDHKASALELRFLAKCLCEALHDALRVAESRGERLPARAYGEPYDDGNSRLSRLADEIDEMEAVQLRAGAGLLGHAGKMLGDHRVGVGELRFLVKPLCEALGDVLRVAENRGGRLPVCADGESHEGPGGAPESERGACK